MCKPYSLGLILTMDLKFGVLTTPLQVFSGLLVLLKAYKNNHTNVSMSTDINPEASDFIDVI